MSLLKKIKGTLAVGFKVALAYRFDFLVTLFTAPISLIVYYFLWKSIFEYSGAEVINGFTFTAMVSYYVLNMIVGFFTWSDIDEWMQESILNGELVFDLLKPIKYLYSTLFFEIGLNSFGIILQAIPILIIAVFFFGMQFTSLTNLAFFMISVLMAFLLYYLMSFSIGIMAFKLKRIDGLHRAKKPIITFLSGGLLPLTFFPLGLQAALKYLPFQYIRFVPINIYLGTYSISEILQLLGIQLAWVVGLFILVKFAWDWAISHFTGVGV